MYLDQGPGRPPLRAHISKHFRTNFGNVSNPSTRSVDSKSKVATKLILTSNPVDALRAHPPTATGDVADSTANDAVGGADTIATRGLGKLFESSDAVDDSVLDGTYSIRDMDGFEKWISDHKSTLCNSGFEPDKPNKKTLVLDPDNTLISSDGYEGDFVVDCNNEKRYSILLHPDCITFLHEMVARYAEIAIYTSSSYVYATKIACQIGVRYARAYPHEDRLPFSKILSSDDCILDGAERKKDLHRLRSLQDVVFVDDDPYYSIRSQNDNVVQVRRFHGKESERSGLMAIVPLLSYLSSVDSVPSTMRKLKKVWYNNRLVKIVQSTMGVNC
ncbi:hypothetical protein PGT21_026216 [Puccinia graminis f. sp. tritici]|uniref:Mitochondrial import inner membrane translocase subunit TIM50 n=1 Tax=Puccinia graminis f. sp. tritici TaxID=56615 RepID=A0A5B0MTF3_PUCGR|nr:hypothetical protein PGT21_026216 [Puccinia graminis f. sp. tritici]